MTGYHVCPDCGKKGVYFKLANYGEDGYICRYCKWGAYEDSRDRVDRVEKNRLRRANPSVVDLGELEIE